MSDLDNAINSINASAAKAENTATFLDDMSTFDDQSSVTNPNNGQTVASIPKQVKDRTDELFTAAESDINQAVADAEQSATDAQDAADSIGRYQGLWPDTGGSADKGDTYQTQVSGTPTGQYFTALQNTTVDPVGDDVNWRAVVSFSSISGANLLSNHNFLIQTPDDSQPLPSATPTSYPPGYQIFSGVFANETTGITNLTYIDGRVSFSGGDLYFAVPNTGAIVRLTSEQLTASVADFDGKPRTRGVSFALVGDEYRVTVGIDALEDASAVLTPLGSVKFEQGSVATGHEVVEPITPTTLPDYTGLVFDSVADAIAGVIANDYKDGTKITVDDYYGGSSPSGSGVLFFTVMPEGTVTNDGGKGVAVNASKQLVQNLRAPYRVESWGGIGDYNTGEETGTDNATFFQNAINYVGSKSSQIPPSTGVIQMNTMPKLMLSEKIYGIGSGLSVPSIFSIEGCRSVIYAIGTERTIDLFTDNQAYYQYAKDIVCYNFKTGFAFDKINNSFLRVEQDNVTYANCEVGLNAKGPTKNLEVNLNKCEFRGVQTWVDIRADMVVMNECHGSSPKGTFTPGGVLKIDSWLCNVYGGIYTPGPDMVGATDLAWFEIGGGAEILQGGQQYLFSGVRFGGETGRATAAIADGCGVVTFNSCTVAASSSSQGQLTGKAVTFLKLKGEAVQQVDITGSAYTFNDPIADVAASFVADDDEARAICGKVKNFNVYGLDLKEASFLPDELLYKSTIKPVRFHGGNDRVLVTTSGCTLFFSVPAGETPQETSTIRQPDFAGFDIELRAGTDTSGVNGSVGVLRAKCFWTMTDTNVVLNSSIIDDHIDSLGGNNVTFNFTDSSGATTFAKQSYVVDGVTYWSIPDLKIQFLSGPNFQFAQTPLTLTLTPIGTA